MSRICGSAGTSCVLALALVVWSSAGRRSRRSCEATQRPLERAASTASVPATGTGGLDPAGSSRGMLPRDCRRPGSRGRSGWRSRRSRWSLATEAIALPLGVLLAFFLFRTDVWGRAAPAGGHRPGGVRAASVARDGLAGRTGQRRPDAGVRRPADPGRPRRGRGRARAGGLALGRLDRGRRALRGRARARRVGAARLRAGRASCCSVTLRRALGAIAAAALAVAVLTAGDMTVTDLLQVRTYAEEAYVQYSLGRGPGRRGGRRACRPCRARDR